MLAHGAMLLLLGPGFPCFTKDRKDSMGLGLRSIGGEVTHSVVGIESGLLI
jgi:hypothetical protein